MQIEFVSFFLFLSVNFLQPLEFMDREANLSAAEHVRKTNFASNKLVSHGDDYTRIETEQPDVSYLKRDRREKRKRLLDIRVSRAELHKIIVEQNTFIRSEWIVKSSSFSMPHLHPKLVSVTWKPSTPRMANST